MKTGNSLWRISLLPHLIMLGTALEFLYFLLFAVAPLPVIHLQASPLAVAWPWTLAPSQWLFPQAWSLHGKFPDPGPYFLLLGLIFTALGCAYLYAVISISRVSSRTTITARWLFLLLAGATVLGATLLLLPALFSTGVFTYISAGHRPDMYYAPPAYSPPKQFAFDLNGSTPIHFSPLLYGPLWLAIASLVVSLGSNNLVITLFLFKGLALLAHLVNIVLIWAILGKIAPARQLLGTLLYAWNPLLLLELAGNAHNDGLVICLLLLAVWLYVQQKEGLAETGALLLLGLASTINLLALLLLPLFAWFMVRNERDIARAIGEFCWRLLFALAIVFLVYLPIWHGSPTYLAIVSSIDMLPFNHSLLASLDAPVRWLFSILAAWQGKGYPGSLVQPTSSADATLIASAIFIFALIYFHLLGRMRKAAASEETQITSDQEMPFPAFEVLLTSWASAILAYVTLASALFWPWYIVWIAWIVALRRLDALTISSLLLSCTGLLYYPFLYLDNSAFAAYVPLLICGIPLVYLIVTTKPFLGVRSIASPEHNKLVPTTSERNEALL